MNRDTHTDALEPAAHNVFGKKANVMICGQFRPPQAHQESTMHATIPEMNKGVMFILHEDSTYLVRVRDPQQGLDQSTESKNFVLRSALAVANPRMPPSNRDLRRNLYVLGLPFDLTKSEFAKVFEPYGTVTHAVILATLDSASRRRGFIVMSTHQGAKAAMDMLSRTQIKGHMLDVSWAVVQRSQGFLDGADRSMMLAIHTPPISERDRLSSIPGGSEDQINNRWELTHVPTSKLMVSNLSTILFTQVSDLHPLFYPFGPIKDIKILGSSPVSPADTAITAVVEYMNASNAQEAKEALQSQSYAGHPIEVHYVCDASPPMHTRLPTSPFLSGSLFGHGRSSDVGLNPFAVPFNVDSRFSTGSQICSPFYDAAIPSGLPSDAPLAPQPFPAHMRPCLMDSISRSSSATSSTWSRDSRPHRSSRASRSSAIRASTYSSYT